MKKLLLIPTLCLVCAACCGKSSCGSSNNDQVQSQETTSDWAITTKVKAEILADTSLSASARFVSVSTTDGVVTLTGSVPTREDRERIYRITRKVNGVKKIDNQITISK
jgi:hyperosmotically inducible periplasmic protein